MSKLKTIKAYTIFLILFSKTYMVLANSYDSSLVKKIDVFYANTSVKVDGILNEEAWLKTKSVSNFIQSFPSPRKVASTKTEVNMVYDDQAIYIGAVLYFPDSIKDLTQLTERDELSNTDWFGIIIDTYQDGNNGVGFFLTSSGVQLDIKYSANSQFDIDDNLILGGDKSWNAIWESKVITTNQVQYIEIKIPFAALRIPKKKKQVGNF